MLYYNGYAISDEYTTLTEDEMYILDACCWLVNYESTIRKTAKMFDFSTTTLWRRIHSKCRDLSPELYECVCRQFQINMERIGLR